MLLTARTLLLATASLSLGLFNPQLSHSGPHDDTWGGYPPSPKLDNQPDPRWLGIPLRKGSTGTATAADVLGPDRIWYPDWSLAGNPEAHVGPADAIFPVEDFGALPNDSLDDAAGLQRAIEAAQTAGGGVVSLATGIYFLDRPILITGDNLTLRGQGASETRLVFRYAGPPAGIEFIHPQPGALVGPNQWLEVHASPKELETLSLYVDDQLILSQRQAPVASWRQSFAIRLRGKRLTENLPPGPVTLRAEARYADGTVQSAEQSIVLTKALQGPPRIPQAVGIGAITFLGARPHGTEFKLREDGRRGDGVLVLEDGGHGFVPGSRIELVAPNTDRWFQEIRNEGPRKPDYRRYHFMVKNVDKNRIQVDQPLRGEFPVADGAFIRRLEPITNSSIEALELEMRSPLPSLNGIMFLNAWACRALNVRVLNAGRHQLLFTGAKWCRVEDGFFRDRRSKGGGTDYVGFQDAYDCLMEDVTAMDMRHAPVVQWSAAGNVIRNSRFLGSDGQWHAGWATENLFENCLIVSRPETGSYGFGMWASPPEDVGHGASGPRNVVYGCDVSSPQAGVWLGGMNENWLFLHNRFIVEDGPGFLARGPARAHLIHNNVFVLKNPSPAAVLLDPEEMEELEFSENRFYLPSGAKVFSMSENAAKQIDNTVHPYPDGALPALPAPGTRSIYEWQVSQQNSGSAARDN